MALGSTQPLTEMSTRCISWGGKGGRYVRLTTLPSSCAVIVKSGDLNLLESSGPLQACNGTAFYMHLSPKCLKSMRQTQPSIEYVPGFISPGIKWLGGEADIILTPLNIRGQLLRNTPTSLLHWICWP